MQKHWVLPATSPHHLLLPLQQVAALVSRLGQSAQDAVAEDLLRLVDDPVPLAQCTIFSFEVGRRAQTVAIGDRSRTQALSHISDAYVSRFWRLDPLLAVMRQEQEAARQAGPANPHIVLHRQRPQDIAHAAYRSTCYTLPQVAERLSILTMLAGECWFSVNLYRGLEHGEFSARDIQVIEAYAPVMVHAVRLHHTGKTLDSGLADTLLSRLTQRYPELTKRDGDIVRCLLDGASSDAMAERLGLTLSSVQTYQKRVYRKLGVGGARELMALVMGGKTP